MKGGVRTKKRERPHTGKRGKAGDTETGGAGTKTTLGFSGKQDFGAAVSCGDGWEDWQSLLWDIGEEGASHRSKSRRDKE